MSKKAQNSVFQIPKLQEPAGDNNKSALKEVTKDKETEKNASQTRSSTPVLGQKASSFFEPDISSIFRHQASKSSGYSSMSKASSMSSICDITKQGTSKGRLTPSAAAAAAHKKKLKSQADRQVDLENLKSKYLQMYALCQLQEKLNRTENSKLEEMLEQYQNKITEKRRVLEETRQQIQQININCELENIHRLHTAVFQQMVDKLETSNCDASLKATSELLEHYKDKVPVKDIEIPEDGLEQLEKSMKNVIESVKDLSTKHNFETYNRLGKANVGLKKCEEVAERCTRKLAELKRLKLQEASLKISYGEKEDDDTSCVF